MQPLPEADAELSHALEGTPYRFLRVLGRGGMSTVVEAEHRGLAQKVVVKLLRPELSARADLVDRLRIEAQSLARLDHPNLVSVSDFGLTPNGLSYLVMERLEGHTFLDELRQRQFLPAAEAIELMLEALAGLEAAHRAGLVHRDVKPENLFICQTPAGRVVKVLDFGIAKLADDAALTGVAPPRFATFDGSPIGTPHFAAPEQLAGENVTPATDVYSAGLVLYELVSGRYPFAAHRTADALHHAQMIEMPPPPSTIAPASIPAALDRAILHAIAKAPKERFSSAEAFARELAAIRAAFDDMPATLRANAPPGIDARSAPTLVSSGVKPAMPLAHTLDVPAKTTPMTAPARAEPRTETLGVLALIFGLTAALAQLGSAFMALEALLDPDEFARSMLGTSTQGADVDGLVRLIGATTLVRTALIGVTAFALALVGVALARRTPRALAQTRTWSSWAIGGVVVGGLLDAGVVLPLQQMALARMPAASGTLALGRGIGLAFGIMILLAAPLVELAIVLGIRLWARRLENR